MNIQLVKKCILSVSHKHKKNPQKTLHWSNFPIHICVLWLMSYIKFSNQDSRVFLGPQLLVRPAHFILTDSLIRTVRIKNIFNFDSRMCYAGPVASVSWEKLPGWTATGLTTGVKFSALAVSIRSSAALGLTQVPVQLVLKVKHLDFPAHHPLHFVLRSRTVAFNPFCSRTPRYNFPSNLYPQSSSCVIQVIHSL